MNILGLPQTSQIGPAARSRAYQYLPYLKQQGIEFTLIPGVPKERHREVYCENNTFKKLLGYSLSLHHRLKQRRDWKKYDVIFVQKETFPQIFPFLENYIGHTYHNLVFDFDDAVFLRYRIPAFFKRIISASSHVIAGNKFLYDFAARYTRCVSLIPTTIDTKVYTCIGKNFSSSLTLGWCGSPTTNRYLTMLEKPLSLLLEKYPRLKLLIISDGFPNISLSLPRERIEYIKWNLEDEISNLQKIDIGLMPLTDDLWSRGKCGFKALQYMSLGIPAICSPVGVNTEIITDGRNGFLAGNDSAWIEKIELLLNNEAVFHTVRLNGRKTVEEKYATGLWAPKLIEIFKNVAAGSKKHE